MGPKNHNFKAMGPNHLNQKAMEPINNFQGHGAYQHFSRPWGKSTFFKGRGAYQHFSRPWGRINSIERPWGQINLFKKPRGDVADAKTEAVKIKIPQIMHYHQTHQHLQ